MCATGVSLMMMMMAVMRAQARVTGSQAPTSHRARHAASHSRDQPQLRLDSRCQPPMLRDRRARRGNAVMRRGAP